MAGRGSGVRQEQARPDAKIAVLSYETAVGLLSRHQVAGGVMQSYLVNGDYLTSLEVQGLERRSAGGRIVFSRQRGEPALGFRSDADSKSRALALLPAALPAGGPSGVRRCRSAAR